MQLLTLHFTHLTYSGFSFISEPFLTGFASDDVWFHEIPSLNQAPSEAKPFRKNTLP